MNHFATPDFWFCHRHLPLEVRELGRSFSRSLAQDTPHR